MNLEEMPHLTTKERWVYVVGRIAIESVDMDAQLRTLRARLAGETGRDAILAGASAWTKTISSCRALLERSDVEERGRVSIAAVLDAADKAWQQRNRYLHDLLVESIQADEKMAPIVPTYIGNDRRLRRRLSHGKGDAPNDEIVTLNQAVDLVLELVAIGWRLRAARDYIQGSSKWNDIMFGHVTGNWDGSAVIYDDDDDDDD